MKVIPVIGVVLLVLALGFYFNPWKTPKISVSAGSQVLETGSLQVGEAIVTKEQVETEYAALPEMVKSELSEEGFAEQLINRELLLLEAKKEGIAISDQEFTVEYQKFLDVYNLTEAQFKTSLGNVSLEFVKADYRQRLTVDKLIRQHVDLNVKVSEEEVQAKMDLLEDDLGADVSAFEGKIREQIRLEKQADSAMEFVNELREDAGIETME